MSVLMLSDVLKDNFYFRLDDDYFRNYFLKKEVLLINRNYLTLKQISHEITDFGAYSQTNLLTFREEGVLFLRNQEIKENYVNLNNAIFIDEDVYNSLTLHLKENDVVIPRVGTLGKAAVISKSLLPCSGNQNLAIIRVNNDLISPYYLSTFLNCDYGIYQIFRCSTGNVQQWLNLENISKLKIHVPSPDFQLAIERLVKQAHSKQDESKSLYATAEALLMEALGIDQVFLDSQTTNKPQANYNVVMLQDILTTNRLDAEYYQPKYEAFFNQVTKFEHCKLTELVEIRKSVETGSEAYSTEGIPYIRVSDINKFGIETPTICISNEYYHENETKLNVLKVKQNTILLSKDGSIGIAYKVDKDLEMLTSGALLHLVVKSNKINPDYLTLVLNSVVVQQQAERDGGGSIIVHWRVSEIEKVIIPILSPELQTQIAQYVQQSFALQQQSKQLLALAKQAVEVAIEQHEVVGLSLIAREQGA